MFGKIYTVNIYSILMFLPINIVFKRVTMSDFCTRERKLKQSLCLYVSIANILEAQYKTQTLSVMQTNNSVHDGCLRLPYFNFNWSSEIQHPRHTAIHTACFWSWPLSNSQALLQNHWVALTSEVHYRSFIIQNCNKAFFLNTIILNFSPYLDKQLNLWFLAVPHYGHFLRVR